MIRELIANEHCLLVLCALREKKGLRFTEIQSKTNLHPEQVRRALAFLRKGVWIVPRAHREGSRILANYELTWRGERFLSKILDPLRENAALFGNSEAAEFAPTLRR